MVAMRRVRARSLRTMRAMVGAGLVTLVSMTSMGPASAAPSTPTPPAPRDIDGALRAHGAADLLPATPPPAPSTAPTVVTADAGDRALQQVVDGVGDVTLPKGDLTATSMAINANRTLTMTNFVSTWTYPYGNDWKLDDTESDWIIERTAVHGVTSEILLAIFNLNGVLRAPVFEVVDGKIGNLICEGTASFSSAAKSYSITVPLTCIGDPVYLRWWARLWYFEYGSTRSTIDDAPDTTWSPYVFNDQRIGPPTAAGTPVGTPVPAGVALTWDPPISAGGAPVRYEVQYSSDGGTSWSALGALMTATNSLTVGALVPGSYIFKVLAMSDLGTSGVWSTPSVPYSPLPGLPSPPVGKPWVERSGDVYWAKPLSTGSFGPNGWKVQQSTDGGATWTKLADLPSSIYLSTPAFWQPGVTYQYRVAAVTTAGVGEWSQPSDPYTTPSRPDAPEILESLGVAGGAFVRWNSVSGVRDANSYAYTIAWREVGTSDWSSTTLYCGLACTYTTITGLTDGLQYEFRVSATMPGIYVSDWSAVGGQVTAGAADHGTVPGTPTAVTATSTSDGAYVSWAPPASDGGATIVDYRVTVTNADGGPPTGVIFLGDKYSGSTATTMFISGLTVGTTYRFKVEALNINGFGPVSELSAPLVISPSDYLSILPARLLDTRPSGYVVDEDPTAFRTGPVAAGGTFTLRVTGRGGVPAGVKAVALNVTAVNPAGKGFVTVYPCDQPRPNSSNVNFEAGVNIPNLVLVKPSATGTVCLFTSQTTNLIADAGGFMPAVAPFTALTPARLLDTRPTGVTIDHLAEKAGAPGPAQVVTVPVTGRGGVPVDAGAVVLNVTAVNPAGKGFLTVYPCDQPRPNSSNVNFVGGVNIANLVVAKVSPSGTVCIYTSQTTHVIADVAGAIPKTAPYQSLVPARLMDTRGSGETIDDVWEKTQRAGETETLMLPVAGRGGVAIDATSVVLNVTVVNPSAAGFVTVYPCSEQRPTASNLNFVAGRTIANAVIVRPWLDVCIYTSMPTDLIVDVAGSFSTV